MRRVVPILLLCVVLAGCGGGGKKSSADVTHHAATGTRPTNAPSTPLILEGAAQGAIPTLRKPPAAVVKLWPANWCRVRKGMMLLQIEKLMGVPQVLDGKKKVSLQAAMTAHVAVWEAAGTSFTAHFGGDHRAVALTGKCARR